MNTNTPLTPEQALQRLRRYCAHSERCHSDVVNKLYDLGVWKKYHDEILASLIEDNFLNEERYAKLFAGGHFRQKQWGRKKIRYHLKQKGISEYCINTAMKEIDEADYLKTLHQLFTKKWQSLSGNKFAKMKKTNDFLVQKGFETELINRCFKNMEP
ncbi:MAG: RecX family transcriptional regulator [Sphingobacteriales bacterium]|jgi:regulatory protein|nr:RecX family transcriptional regulator [Sphingobacteriales bacterium]